MRRASVHLVLLLAALYSVLPLVWLVTSATKSLGEILHHQRLRFRPLEPRRQRERAVRPGRRRFPVVDPEFAALRRSRRGLGSLICTAAGYAIAKLSFPGRRLLFALTLAGVLVPTTALALPLYLLAAQLHLVDTFWAVFLPLLTNPFGVYLARVYADAAVPGEVLEASRMDGAGELRTFFTVALPMMRPGLVTVLLFQFVGIWNNVFLPLVMLTDPRLFPMSLGLFQWSTRVTQFPQYTPLVVTGSLLAVRRW